MSKRRDKTLEAEVRRIILNQALQYLPDAIESLGTLAKGAESEHARVSAARVLIGSMQIAAEGMTEEEAGQTLLNAIAAASHNVDGGDVPPGIRHAWEDDDDGPGADVSE